jgi:thiol-disulfide isomerase/thioredoxin
MKYFSIIAFFLFLSFTELSGQSIQHIDGEGIAVLSSLSDDTTYVLNFWATWCSPCVKEIAIFEKLHKDNTYPELKVILISLDFVNQLERRVIPFLEEKGISAEVRIMTNTDYNAWIDRVDPSWTGAIPATLIYNRDHRVFLEKELTYNELVKQIHQIQN